MPLSPDSPPTVLNVSHHNFVAGGSDRVFAELGALLTEQGHRVVPFCARDEHNDPSEFEAYFPPGTNTENPGLGDIARFIYSGAARKALRELLAVEKIDLAHLHIYYGKLTASILKPLRERRIPIVQTLHEYKLACPVYTLTSAGRPCEACFGGRYWRALPRLCNRNSLARTSLSVVESYVSKALGAMDSVDHFVGISDFVTGKMIASGIPAERITTVHNFVDTRQYEPATRTGDYVVFFGRLETVKGVYSLLEAFSEMPHVRLLVAGTGAEAANIAAWVAARKLDNIELLGFVGGTELHDLLRGALCTVVPSEWQEPFGLTVLESMALGKAVIATDMGGIPEVVSAGEDGLLVPPWDPAALRAAVLELVGNPRRAADMGRAARVKVEREFDRHAHYEKLSAVYAQARTHAAAS